jgi:serine/threonine-protein kinase
MECTPSAPLIGRKIGCYLIRSVVGRGGMAVVYRARDLGRRRDVALKVLDSRTGADAIARFCCEATWLASCRDPHIVRIFDTGRAGGVHYIAMELMATTLQARLTDRRPGCDELVAVGAGLLRGLVAAHRAGLIHRDIKPANVGIAVGGRVVLLDFGVARPLPWSGCLRDCATIQPLSCLAGTMQYMAPEQLCGAVVDERVDVYGAGAVLYEFATGRAPFAHLRDGALIDAILHHAPRRPSERHPAITPALESVVLRALDKDPSRRFASAAAMLHALRHAALPAPAALAFGAPRRRAGPLEAAV